MPHTPRAIETAPEPTRRWSSGASSRAAAAKDGTGEPSLGEAFEAFYRAHYGFVWRNARSMVPGRDESVAEDLVQDTFTVAYRRFESYDGRAAATTWLFGILRNVARNHTRSERRRSRRRAALAEAQPKPEGRELEAIMARRLLEGFLAELDPDKRAVFVLAEVEGLTRREIAASLGVNPNTVGTRLRAARQLFCRHFELPRSREAIRRQTQPLRELEPGETERARTRAGLLLALGPGLERAGPGAGGLALRAKLGGLKFAVGLAAVAGLAYVAVSDQGSEPPGERAPAAEASVALDRPALPRAESRPPAPNLVHEREGPGSDPIEVEPTPTRGAAGSGRASRPHASTPAGGSGGEAFELIRRARAELVEGEPARALEILASMPEDADGFVAQRVATEVAALCALGRSSEASARVRALAARDPASAMLERLDHACW